MATTTTYFDHNSSFFGIGTYMNLYAFIILYRQFIIGEINN